MWVLKDLDPCGIDRQLKYLTYLLMDNGEGFFLCPRPSSPPIGV